MESTNSNESATLSVADAANALEAMLPDEGEQQEDDAQPLEQSEEADEAEAQAEDESEQSDDDEQTDEGEEEPAQTIRVKVDGQELEVTLDELKAGYSRQQTFTKRTQELSEQRRALEAEAQAVQSERQQYAQVLAQLSQQLESSIGQEPDWEALRQSDPIEYSLQYADYQRKAMKLQAAQQEQARVAALMQAEQQKQLEAHLAREKQALDAAIPEWKDATRARAEKALILEQGKKLGFSEQELAQAYDHRAILALRKAALYDRMMEQAKAAKPAPTRTVVPGSKPLHGNSSTKKALDRAQQTGNVKDAARAIELLLS